MGERIPMFPLSTVLFPHATLPLHIFEHRYRVMTERCLETDARFGVVLISRGSEVGGGDTRVSVGTTAHVEQAASLPDGRWMLLVRGHARFRVTEWLADDPYPQGIVEWLPEPADGAEFSAVLDAATAAVTRARALLSELKDASAPPAVLPDDAVTRSWWLCEHAPLTSLDRQRLLECGDIGMRLALLGELTDAVADDLARLLAGG